MFLSTIRESNIPKISLGLYLFRRKGFCLILQEKSSLLHEMHAWQYRIHSMRIALLWTMGPVYAKKNRKNKSTHAAWITAKRVSRNVRRKIYKMMEVISKTDFSSSLP